MTAVLSITKVGRRLAEVSKKDLGIRAVKPWYPWLAGKSNPLIIIFEAHFAKMRLVLLCSPQILRKKAPAKELHQQKKIL